MKTDSRKPKRPAEAKTSRTAQRKGDYVQRLVRRWKEYPCALRFRLYLEGRKMCKADSKMLDALCEEDDKKPEIPY